MILMPPLRRGHFPARGYAGRKEAREGLKAKQKTGLSKQAGLFGGRYRTRTCDPLHVKEYVKGDMNPLRCKQLRLFTFWVLQHFLQ